MRITLFCVVFALSVIFPYPVFVILALIYLFLYKGYELLFLAGSIDAFFGQSEYSFLYFVTTSTLLLVFHVVRLGMYLPKKI
jgi:hypothetical protein